MMEVKVSKKLGCFILKLKDKSFVFKYIVKACLFGLLFTFIFIVPDYVVKLFSSNYIAEFHPKAFKLIFMIVAPVILVKSNYLFCFLSVVLWILLFAGFFYYFHFGRYFSDVDVSMILKEREDILLGLKSDIITYWYLFLLMFVLLFLVFYVRRISTRYLKSSNFFFFIFLFSLVKYYNFFSLGGGENSYLIPNPLRYMMDNSVKSIYSYFINILPYNQQIKIFKPYKIVKKKDIKEKINILLIMGESWTPSHMSLYGYNLKTTPSLDRLKKLPNFVYKEGRSFSVCTTISLNMFFNQQKEPFNSLVSFSYDFNILKLAKQQGFYTSFISPQGSAVFPGIGIEYVDTPVYYIGANKKEFDKYHDNYSLMVLKDLKLTDKNFIILQTRATHFPYRYLPRNYPSFDKFQIKGRDQRLNDYDAGISYIDYYINEVINFANKLEGKTYVIVVSDHGQILGSDNLWGHGFVHDEVGKIPIILWFNNVDTKEYNYLNNYKYLHHYDITKFITTILGYDLYNPNTSEDEFYLSSCKINGVGGFIHYKRDKNKLSIIDRYK